MISNYAFMVTEAVSFFILESILLWKDLLYNIVMCLYTCLWLFSFLSPSVLANAPQGFIYAWQVLYCWAISPIFNICLKQNANYLKSKTLFPLNPKYCSLMRRKLECFPCFPYSRESSENWRAFWSKQCQEFYPIPSSALLGMFPK